MRLLKDYKFYLAAVCVFYGIGILFFRDFKPVSTAIESSAQGPLFLVKVLEQEAKTVDKQYVLNAKTEPVRTVHLRAETSGKILKTAASKGDFVQQGALLVQIDPREKESLVKKAAALLAQKKTEFQASEDLLEKGYEASNHFMAAQFALEEAQAEYESRVLSLGYTEVKAPLSGFLNTRVVEEGDFVAIGDPIATLVQTHPLLVVAYATENQVLQLKTSMLAYVEFKDRPRIEGKVRYISQVAELSTRTYRIEVEIPNADYQLPAGMSASLTLPYEKVKAQVCSPSLLCLDSEGDIGLKIVDDHNRVSFYKAEIIQSDLSSISLVGLPDKARIICQGQDFVLVGQEVAVAF